MSIIERSNPLNLQYRVTIVTNASSPLGVIICKTFLKANALVLGTDARPRDHSLNAGLGTHFQFDSCNLKEGGAAAQIVEASRAKFGVERIDVLINIIEGPSNEAIAGVMELSIEVAKVMKEKRCGKIINIVGDLEAKNSPVITSLTRKLVAVLKSDDGVTINMVAPWLAPSGSASAKAYEKAKTHMTTLMKTEKIDKDAPSISASKEEANRMYDLGNLTLFLAGDMSEMIASSIISLDGRYASVD